MSYASIKSSLYRQLYTWKLKHDGFAADLSRPFDKLLIIAHPDDELIFFDQLLQKEHGWLVVCLTNGDHPVRRCEFLNSMAYFKASYILWNHPDGLDVVWHEAPIRNGLSNILALRSRWQQIATHNEEGEYGHPQHIQLHKIVKSLDIDIEISTSNNNDPKTIMYNLNTEDKSDVFLSLYPSQAYALIEHRKYFN